MRKLLGFFKLPLQIMLGGYATFMLIAISVAIIEEYTEYEDDFPFCGDVEREASFLEAPSERIILVQT